MIDAVDIRDLGAAPDDGSRTVECTSAIQSAIAAAAAGGGLVYIPRLPAGWAWRTVDTLDNSAGASVVGGPTSPYSMATALERGRLHRGAGSWLHCDHNGIGIHITSSVDADLGATMEHFGIVRTQPEPEPGWEPTDTGFDIEIAAQSASAGSVAGIVLRDVVLLNTTRGIHSGQRTGRVWMQNIKGQAFRTMICMDGCTDVNYLWGIHQWPIYSGDAHIIGYQMAHLDTLDCGRVDNSQVFGLFSIFQRHHLRLRNGATGLGAAPAKVKVFGIDADVGDIAILVDADNATADFALVTSQGELGTGLGRPVLYVTGNDNTLTFQGVRNTISYTNAVRIAEGATGNRVFFNHLRAELYDHSHAGAPTINPAVWVDAGNTVYIDGPFAHDTHAATAYAVGGGGTVIQS